MSLPSPPTIVAKAERAYPRFLRKWVRGEDDDFFPYHVRVLLPLDAKKLKATIDADERLMLKSKTECGWGYTVHREQKRKRDLGSSSVPTSITIDTLDDLLRLAKKKEEFASTERVVDRIRSELPQLGDWLVKHVRSLWEKAGSIDGLIAVTKYFVENPWPDCYARQIPVPVDTKFVHRHKVILRQWLDILLPDSAIDVNETKFARRFGLRDGQQHREFRVLDLQLLDELGLAFDELSLPLRSMATLNVKNATVVIVENDTNLFTLPSYERGIAIRGKGDSAVLLERVRWLDNNRVFYWGDIDVEGFLILSRLRNLFPHVESLMMDHETIQQFEEYVVGGEGSKPNAPTNLTENEAAAFAFCLQGNHRLEQEKISQPYVDERFAALETSQQ